MIFQRPQDDPHRALQKAHGAYVAAMATKRPALIRKAALALAESKKAVS